MKKFISIMFIFILLFQISGCNSDNADLIMPEKGQNISIENNEYKVIKVDGKNALLLLNEPYGEIITFGNNNSYENSNVDKACEDFYNSLPDNMKKAIKNIKININEYNDDSANRGSYLYESKKRVQTLSRHAYLLDLEDIEDFLNGEHTTDSINNLINDRKNEIPWWFRSKCMNSDNAIWCLYTYSAVINGYSINNELAVRPAFVIDLSEVDFNINE